MIPYQFLFVSSLFSFRTAIGIVMIMTKATSRLDDQQQEKYGGQEKYDTWVKKVKSPLFPFL